MNRNALLDQAHGAHLRGTPDARTPATTRHDLRRQTPRTERTAVQ